MAHAPIIEQGHNHVTRIVKTDGSCPACNEYFERAAEEEQ